MRDYMMDANILMSILISGRSDYRPLLTYYNFLLPEFVLVEIEKYSHIIKKKSRRNEQEFLLWTYFRKMKRKGTIGSVTTEPMRTKILLKESCMEKYQSRFG